MSVRNSPMTWLVAVVLLGLTLRTGACFVLSENLDNDRDIYLALADGVAEGRGYSSPGSTQPTAFRPPLFPLVLALPGLRTPMGLAVLQVLLGGAVILLTYRLAQVLGLSSRQCIAAAGLIAVDPLQLLYTTQPMTEVICTVLVTALLLAIVPARDENNAIVRAAVAGGVFGLAALCRPTVWVFGVLAVGWWFLRCVRRRRSQGDLRLSIQYGLVAIAASGVVVAPWLVRNIRVMQHPIVTTTHGGYTLLLGNNPSFYREVVNQPLGTVWDGSHGDGQAAWAAALNQQMESLGLHGEVERDRWMNERAWSHIAGQPADFVRACLLRFIRFWNVVPSGETADRSSQMIRLGAGFFYGVELLAALIGVVVALRADARRWMPIVLLVAAFTGVHLLYWSNARMRAPIMPAVALLAASVIPLRGRQRYGHPLTSG